MEDISPEIFAAVKKDFNAMVEKDDFIAIFTRKLQTGKATFEDTQRYARKLGNLLGRSLQRNINLDELPNNRFYFNIADKVIPPMFAENHSMVMAASSEVQKVLDKKIGIKLNPIKPPLKTDRVKDILNNVTQEGLSEVQISERLLANTENLTQTFFDDFVYENAKFRSNAGLKQEVIRIYSAEKACPWCRDLAGTYDYDEVKNKGNDVWLRHQNCHCQIIYRIKNEYFRNKKRLR